jgi:hypothetical protein
MTIPLEGLYIHDLPLDVHHESQAVAMPWSVDIVDAMLEELIARHVSCGSAKNRQERTC